MNQYKMNFYNVLLLCDDKERDFITALYQALFKTALESYRCINPDWVIRRELFNSLSWGLVVNPENGELQLMNRCVNDLREAGWTFKSIAEWLLTCEWSPSTCVLTKKDEGGQKTGRRKLG